jgi:hypothetical protein
MGKPKRDMDTRLRTSIRSDMDAIEKVCVRWAATDTNEIEPADMAAMLADFYTGIEAICVRIAETADGPIEKDAEGGWETDLLDRLARPVGGGRAAVLTPALKRHLLQFHNLRAYLRETPGATPAGEMLRALLCSMEATLTQFRAAVLRFLESVRV